jgi:hypothetical protein
VSTAARYVIGAVLAFLIGASCQLDGPDETTTEALVQADKADAITAARRAADPRIAVITGSQQ